MFSRLSRYLAPSLAELRALGGTSVHLLPVALLRWHTAVTPPRREKKDRAVATRDWTMALPPSHADGAAAGGGGTAATWRALRALQTAQPTTRRVTFVAPPGCAPGQHVTVSTPDGRASVQVALPANVAPGQASVLVYFSLVPAPVGGALVTGEQPA